MSFLGSTAVYFAILCVTIGIYHVSCDDDENDNKLLLIMVDACRWDYPDDDSVKLPGFQKLAENGVRAPYVTPVYPSMTYPNWLSLVTGLYPESHGFVANHMYDSEYDDLFLMAPDKSADVKHWWQHAEPLWITAEKHNKSSALFFWDGCQVEIRGKKPSYCEPYKYLGWPYAINITNHTFMKALDWFSKDEKQLVQLYYEPVDYRGHGYGPDSNERKYALKGIDMLLDTLQEEMNKTGLLDKVNIVVFSDHGMIHKDPNKMNYISLETILDASDVRYVIGTGTSLMLLPYEGKVEKVYKALQGIPGLKVYKKEDIPERYHLKNSHLTLPLLLVPSKNYFVQGLGIPGNIGVHSYPSTGMHGYDPEDLHEMRGIFFARGPRLKRNHISPPIHTVDVYNILCYLLNIEPLPNNGTMSIVKEIQNAKMEDSDGKIEEKVSSPKMEDSDGKIEEKTSSPKMEDSDRKIQEKGSSAKSGCTRCHLKFTLLIFFFCTIFLSKHFLINT